jgi:hypothetical protein
MKAGKPRNEDNQLFKAKKETNNKLRCAIKMHNNQNSTEEKNVLVLPSARFLVWPGAWTRCT